MSNFDIMATKWKEKNFLEIANKQLQLLLLGIDVEKVLDERKKTIKTATLQDIVDADNIRFFTKKEQDSLTQTIKSTAHKYFHTYPEQLTWKIYDYYIKNKILNNIPTEINKNDLFGNLVLAYYEVNIGGSKEVFILQKNKGSDKIYAWVLPQNKNEAYFGYESLSDLRDKFALLKVFLTPITLRELINREYRRSAAELLQNDTFKPE